MKWLKAGSWTECYNSQLCYFSIKAHTHTYQKKLRNVFNIALEGRQFSQTTLLFFGSIAFLCWLGKYNWLGLIWTWI